VALSFSERDYDITEQSRSLICRIYSKLGAVDIEEFALSWSQHDTGTCRMGDGPRNGVTDGDLRVHESPNLYVAGSAVFTSGGAAHPTLAITVLSQRMAEHLSSEVSSCLRMLHKR
jgi:choline dehydrogenase-like flavoprotein